MRYYTLIRMCKTVGGTRTSYNALNTCNSLCINEAYFFYYQLAICQALQSENMLLSNPSKLMHLLVTQSY